MTGDKKESKPADSSDWLESFGIYQLARQLFEDFWNDSEILNKDFRGRELVKQQVRSLDSVCANMEEGFGRGFGKELPQHLKISRGEARESRGRYERCNHLLPPETITQRVSALSRIIGGLSKTIQTVENRARRQS
ncbi:MAG: four helix bundle protein [Verrucomicrobiota bacterium]